MIFLFRNIFLLLLIICLNIQAQDDFSVVFNKNYLDIPLKIRIENDGIFFISGFHVEKGTISFNSFDENVRLIYKGNNLIGKLNLQSIQEMQELRKTIKDDDFSFKQILSLDKHENRKYFYYKDGVYFGPDNQIIELIRENSSLLKVVVRTQSESTSYSLKFNNNLACAYYAGLDKESDHFIITERFVSQIPLIVERFLLIVSSDGIIKATLKLAEHKYLYTIFDCTIDEEGNFYQLLSNPNGIEVIKWKKEKLINNNYSEYPDTYKKLIHFNYHVPITEYISDLKEIPLNIKTLSSRTQALRIGESYVLHKYTCKADNLAPFKVRGPDGDTVQTPPWLIIGQNARVPYKWGGFDNLSSFNTGLAANKYAGDIHTKGVSAYSVGVDCSGFVSRCWQLSYHSSTSSMPNITTLYPGWDYLKPGDAVHKVGHVRLFVKFNLNGSLKIVESAGREWDVSYWSFNYSDLLEYTPRYYNNMVPDFSDKTVNLNSALLKNNKVELKWAVNDTSNIKGYKIYHSQDGINYFLFMDENSVKTTSCVFDFINTRNSFRVAAVSADGNNSESFWSNSLIINSVNSGNRILLVDGFERDNASWQGSGHTFLNKFANILNKFNINYESCKNNSVINEEIDLNNYNIIFWMLGDESINNITLDSTEQQKIIQYLENGGNLFITGSEIGYDLYQNGNINDKYFYNNYLKATYQADNSGNNIVKSVPYQIFDSTQFLLGQTYYENSPDVILPYGGSSSSLQYNNGLTAAVIFNGKFSPTATKEGKLIYLAFALETTANDSAFNFIISKALNYFSIINKVKSSDNLFPEDLDISMVYPNPFNSTIRIRIKLKEEKFVNFSLFDNLGRMRKDFSGKKFNSGTNYFEVNTEEFKLSSGIYYLRVNSESYSKILKLTYLK